MDVTVAWDILHLPHIVCVLGVEMAVVVLRAIGSQGTARPHGVVVQVAVCLGVETEVDHVMLLVVRRCYKIEVNVFVRKRLLV
jgi:hypothetical protein